MRRSPQSHTLAVLRILLGLTQKEMASLLECSTPTIQAIELGKLAMSHKFADNLSHQAGVSYEWLMDDDVSNPPVDFHDQPYTKASFDYRRALLLAPPEDSSDVRRNLFAARASFRCAVEQLAILFKYAYQGGSTNMCAYKIRTALRELIVDQVPMQKLTPEENEQLHRFGILRFKLEDLQAPVTRFVEDTDKIFQAQIAEHEPTPPSGHHPASGHDLPKKLQKVWRKKKPVPLSELRQPTPRSQNAASESSGKAIGQQNGPRVAKSAQL
jgi:transcriptional regulator with XRE-family HTH domain